MIRYGSAYMEFFQSALLTQDNATEGVMPIIQEVSFSKFCDEFNRHDGRYNQLGGYDGLRVLFDHLESVSEDLGESITLDVIGLCCDYAHYEDLGEVRDEYGLTGDDEETRAYLNDNTTLLEYGGGLIIRQF